LTRMPVIIRVFSVTGIIPARLDKIGITGLIFSVRGRFIEVLGKSVAKE